MSVIDVTVLRYLAAVQSLSGLTLLLPVKANPGLGLMPKPPCVSLPRGEPETVGRVMQWLWIIYTVELVISRGSYGFLTTDLNALVTPIHQKARPVLLLTR